MMLLADTILIAHALFVAFVTGGLLVTVVGLLRGWRWVRNFWFRAAHLAAVVFVVGQTWLGIDCPLTVREHALRVAAGHGGYPDGFIAYWLHRAIFYDAEPRVFMVAYTVFGALVVATWIWGRPRWPGTP
jgi:hypothetical protein